MSSPARDARDRHRSPGRLRGLVVLAIDITLRAVDPCSQRWGSDAVDALLSCRASCG
jgi:hypothetical protein